MTIQPAKLFTPLKTGAIPLKHRVVMAPLTRFRAHEGTGVPSELAIEYYKQRASDGGLIITEATFISDAARGYDKVPGIYTPEQVEGWKKITDAVHSKGGFIFCQLWHLGRVAVPQIAPTVYAASDIPDPSNDGPKPKLHVMTEQDIDRTVDEYVHAAKTAREAGFDGVEIHGANGYLIDQFLQAVSNQRTDSYGGSLENRFRFPLRVLNGVAGAIGADRVGIRMSPFSTFQGMREEKPLETFIPWTETIVANQPELAYIHAVEARATGNVDQPLDQQKKEDTLVPIRDVILSKSKGTVFMVAGGYGKEPDTAKEHAEKYDDLVAFGRYFISNPDLPIRLKNGWPLKDYVRDTFYSPGPEGYVDFPEYKAIAQDDAAHPDNED
ncbi:NADPH2 dehydrogenase [Kwoniella heveanensis CBS 569]|uniref:NADPH2 dehydrogenase n=1 Tax=Kwoniella heveanensis BCC8398 TaxID=1296120 RepID=A0A1B9GZJ9_9TREE|nr:NADPH2 dehydrogenase [Kwoniella heveanensis BCC8398]OCF44138.1 NADPH2 dehydrogenase [Kwoniella heveanensis CBS 569]